MDGRTEEKALRRLNTFFLESVLMYDKAHGHYQLAILLNLEKE